MKRIRGGSGLGDGIYVRVIADHLISQGHEVEACSNYADVFIGSGAKVSPFRRDKIDVLCHYSAKKDRPNTTQWRDICDTAGVGEIPLSLKWTIQNPVLVEEVKSKSAGKPVVLVLGGREPMGRTDGFGSELLPERHAFDLILRELKEHCFLVRIGKGEQIYPLHADLDLNDATSVSDILDLGASCAAVVAQCSFAMPLAECFDKPLLAVWSSRGLYSGKQYIKTITPKKILEKPSSQFVMDDWPEEQIKAAARAFCKF